MTAAHRCVTMARAGRQSTAAPKKRLNRCGAQKTPASGLSATTAPCSALMACFGPSHPARAQDPEPVCAGIDPSGQLYRQPDLRRRRSRHGNEHKWRRLAARSKHKRNHDPHPAPYRQPPPTSGLPETREPSSIATFALRRYTHHLRQSHTAGRFPCAHTEGLRHYERVTGATIAARRSQRLGRPTALVTWFAAYSHHAACRNPSLVVLVAVEHLWF